MSIFEQLRWSLRHSQRQLLESILVVVAIGLGVGVIVTVFSLLLAVNEQYQSIEQEDYYRTLELVSQVDLLAQGGAPLVLIGSERALANWSASILEIEELQKYLPQALHAFVENNWTARTSLDVASQETEFEWLEGNELFVTGTTPEYLFFKDFSLTQGSWILPQDVQEKKQVMVLSQALAQELFGDQDPLGQIVPLESFRRAEYVPYTVIGVLEEYSEKGNEDSYFLYRTARSAYVPITASPYIRENDLTFSQISIGVDKGFSLTKAYEIVQSEASFIWGERVGIQSPYQNFQIIQQQFQNYALLMGVFASVGLVIAVINILNLMLARVLKRTKGIGLSMALGSSRWLVFRQFLLEALSLGFVGSLLGILLSIVLEKVLQNVVGLPFLGTQHVANIVIGVGLGFVISLLFGVYPAYLGSKTNPIDALRTD